MVLVIIAVLVVGGGTYYFIHENSTKQKQAILKLDENAKNEIWNLIYSSLINDFKPLANYSVFEPVSYTHLRAHETVLDLVCRLLLEKKKHTQTQET